MLQLIQTLHNFSVVHPTLYFVPLVLLACVVCPGWYKFGRLQLAAAYASPAPHAAARPRVVLYRRGAAVVLQLTGLLILSSLEIRSDGAAFTLAVKVT
jgi:hypothetical protein